MDEVTVHKLVNMFSVALKSVCHELIHFQSQLQVDTKGTALLICLHSFHFNL